MHAFNRNFLLKTRGRSNCHFRRTPNCGERLRNSTCLIILNIDVELGVTRVEFTGILTADDLVGVDAAVRTHPDFCPELDQLVDFCHSDPSGLLRNDIAQIVRLPIAFSDKSKRAFLVGDDKLTFGLGGMYERMRNAPEGQIQFFNTPGEAKTWLGID